MTMLEDSPTLSQGLETPRRRRWWVAIGGVLAFATVAWATLNVVALLAHRTTTARHEYAAAGVTSLSVTTGTGDVRIVGTESDRITVTSTIDEGLRTPRNTQELRGGVLSIDSACPSFSIMWCGVSYLIEVPGDRPLTLRTGTGDITISGVTADLTVSTDTGDVSISGAGPSAVDASTDTGDVSIDFAAAPSAVTLRSDTGNLHLVVPDDGRAYVVSADSDTGDAKTEVKTDPASPYPVTLRSGTGNVSVRYAGS